VNAAYVRNSVYRPADSSRKALDGNTAHRTRQACTEVPLERVDVLIGTSSRGSSSGDKKSSICMHMHANSFSTLLLQREAYFRVQGAHKLQNSEKALQELGYHACVSHELCYICQRALPRKVVRERISAVTYNASQGK
jgi:hypothetical protein